MAEGLRRAKAAAETTRGIVRPVHLRGHVGGNSTKCGHGGVTFSAPITDDPAEATCKNCLKIHRAIEQDRKAREMAREYRQD